MSGPTVLEDPAAFDVFSLNGEFWVGSAEIVSGGDAKEEIQDQGQPLTTGSNTVVRRSMNAITTYQLKMWLPPHFALWDKWEKMFLDGRSRRPVRVYKLQDLRYSWVAKVVFEKMTPQKTLKPGGPWAREIELHQYVRVKAYGGPVKDQNPLAAQTAAQSAHNAAAQKTLDQHAATGQAARRAKK